MTVKAHTRLNNKAILYLGLMRRTVPCCGTGWPAYYDAKTDESADRYEMFIKRLARKGKSAGGSKGVTMQVDSNIEYTANGAPVQPWLTEKWIKENANSWFAPRLRYTFKSAAGAEPVRSLSSLFFTISLG